MFRTMILSAFMACILCPVLVAFADGTDGPSIEGACDGAHYLPLTYENGVPTIQVQIGGERFTAVLDSGAAVTLFGHNLATIGGPRTKPTTASTFYGDIEIARTVIDKIILGGDCAITNIPVKVHIGDNETFTKGFDGRILIGRDIFGQLDLLFDAGNDRMAIRRASTPQNRIGRTYEIVYDTGKTQYSCVFDSGLSHDETGHDEIMRIGVGARILAERHTFQPLGKKYDRASQSGEVSLVAMAGRIAGGPYQSFIAAIEEPSDPPDETFADCYIGAKYMLDNRLILRAHKRFVDRGKQEPKNSKNTENAKNTENTGEQ